MRIQPTIISAALLLVAWAPLPPASTAECPTSLQPVDASSPPDFTGRYRLVMAATEGPKQGRIARGTVTLRRLHGPIPMPKVTGGTYDYATVHPFYGTAAIDLAAVGATTMGSLSAADSLAPGAAIEVITGRGNHPVLELSLGSGNNDHGKLILDGAITPMVIERAGPDGFTGHWDAYYSYTTYHAAGTFCATRIGGQ
jgi:hypothetical protein